ncbi:MAG: DUF1997 domain-containing protein [Cyanobacteria bacterium J083]|nr:MAG: DUF1997 domain-containing protein [Cyanobacteria bacterium J083]
MYLSFTASESVNILVESEEIPIKHYLRQPARLVKAIANPQLIRDLGQDCYELKMRPLNLLEIYKFQPVVVLQVTANSAGEVSLKSKSCQIRGIDYINERFYLDVTGQLSPHIQADKTYLRGKANLKVKVGLPPAMMFTPKPLLEMAGNSLVRGVLARIKHRLVSQLLKDYSHWLDQQKNTAHSSSLINITPNSAN